MITIILVIHLMLAIAMIGVIMIQKSEGGALGIGGGAGGGFMTARGTASLLTRTTAILAATFMATSLVLAILSGAGSERKSILDAAPAASEAPLSTETPAATPEAPAEPVAPSVPVAK